MSPEQTAAALPRWKQRGPNVLTLARVAMAAAVFAALARVGAADLTAEGLRLELALAAGLFVLAALTDALDGHLARRWGAATAFGRVVDPAADKLLVLGTFAMLAGPAFALPAAEGGAARLASGVAPWMVVALIARELLSTSIRAVAEGSGVAFAANWFGKGKMIAQSLCAPLVLTLLAFASPAALDQGGWARWTIDAAVWTMLVATAVSAWPYLRAVARTFAVDDIGAVHRAGGA